jgi:hypothetical protein
MDDLGLAVAFCVVQVTLLAAVVSVCYLCSRRSHPGFRSSIASTGVFVVLALSALCLSPYPNWVAVLDLGQTPSGSAVSAVERVPVTAAAGLDQRAATPVAAREDLSGPVSRDSVFEVGMAAVADNSRRPQADAGLTSPVVVDGSPSLANPGLLAAGREGQAATSRRWSGKISAILQPVLTGIVGLRDRLADRFQWLLQWGWLAGVLLLAGVTFNLLRLAVGWWELRRFRHRSTLIDSPALQESLDIVQAALSVRVPVELRQTAEMTSPATIGWWRPVVILPADWEDWNEEERLGVLAHELAHVSRHDFITGLFSQLVLSLHFYHPLINWLVNRLHLEQELAADAAAVRVLGGHKPYLRMLAEMALRDHTASLPGPARTFWPQPGMLITRVELLRGNKLEAGEGSFSWRAAVRGVVVCVGLVLAGLRPLAGSDAAERPVVRLGSKFVPQSAAAWVVWAPKQVRGSHPVSSLLFDPANRWPDELVEGLEQVSLFWVDSDGSVTGEVNSLLPDGVALNFRSKDIRDAVFAYLKHNPEQNLGYRLLGGPAPQRAVLSPEGECNLLLCRDEMVLNLSVTSASNSPSPDWIAAWDRAATGDAVIGFRPGMVSRFQVAHANYTAVLGDLVDQLSDWSRTAEFALAALDLDHDQFQLQVIPKTGGSSQTLVSAVEGLKKDWKLRVAKPVPPGGQDPENYDPVHGNTWCQRLVSHCPTEALSDRLQVDASLSAILGIALRLRDLPDEVVSFEQHWLVHERAYLEQSVDLLRSALLAYRVDHGGFPPLALQREPAAPLHSWRVALLPYLGRKDLYAAYRFDLPWDSPENLQLLSRIPEIYRGFGSLSNTSPVLHGSALSPATVSRVLNDWTDVDNLVLFSSSAGEIPWTSPLDGLSAASLMRAGARPGSAGGLAELTTGDLEQRIWSTVGGSMSE